ncbi:MAG TPA: DeoR family transcriptional regulator [Alphaproteobacteria bacterium]|nr:DeoR family transcriptional regulator [Alphaproteobacteria bacterium]USO05442.1 MAG: DeoR family transcriptional regulator [Rhodospirillales bacterium]HOO81390.1 DeoR family transcriptional regulator [Alphaproteobacteria bacterium]
MSLRKTDRVFQTRNQELSNKKLAEIIAGALRSDFGDLYSSVKEIDRATGIKFNTVKKWYEASTVPSLRHFLLLLECSSSLREFVLCYLFGEDILDDLALISSVDQSRPVFENNTDFEPKNVTINDTIRLNERQKWFLLLLQNERKAAAKNIVEKWGVSFRTARRDIQGLKEDGRIEYCGSNKSGRYSINRLGH